VRRTRGIAPALVVPAAVGLAFLVLPLVALVVRAPWGSIVQVVAKQEVLQALLLSRR
jgi:molybdate transport system permease protein